MEAPFNMEDKLWKAIVFEDFDQARKMLCDTANITINAEKMNVDTFVKNLSELGCKSYTLEQFYVSDNKRDEVEVSYETSITIKEGYITSASGHYSIVSRWNRKKERIIGISITKAS